MRNLIGILIFALLGMMSCKNDKNGHLEDAPQGINQEKEDRVDDAQLGEEKNDNAKLHLNHGKKWIVNDATHIGMTNIKSLLTEYVKNDGTDHIALANAMSQETSTLISKCDMVGPDHDQLHLILLPILEDINEIKKSNYAQPLMDLSVHLSDYFDHFQKKK